MKKYNKQKRHSIIEHHCELLGDACDIHHFLFKGFSKSGGRNPRGEVAIAMEFNPRFNAAHYIDLIEGDTAPAPAASARDDRNGPAPPQSSEGLMYSFSSVM